MTIFRSGGVFVVPHEGHRPQCAQTSARLGGPARPSGRMVRYSTALRSALRTEGSSGRATRDPMWLDVQ